MMVQKGETHKHKYTKEVTKTIPVRGESGISAKDTIKMRECRCGATLAYDMTREKK